MHETMRRLYEAARAMKGAETPSEVARLLDESPQTVKNWESRGISKNGLLKAQAVIGCLTDWVSTGSGPMSLFDTGPSLAEADAATGYVADSVDPVRLSERLRTHRLPLIGWEQVGKIGVAPMESLDIARFMESPFQSSDASFLLELGSESMLPEYSPGQIIQVDPLVQASSGDDVVVLFPSGKSTFRRLVDSEDGRILQALNPHWPDRLMQWPPGTRIVGVVVGYWKSIRK